MAEDAENRRGGNRWRIARWGAAVLLLLLPWAAMQFTGEVAWDVGDFVILGAMLAGACAAYELAASGAGSRAWRAGIAVALIAAFILVWMNLAVGVIGSERNPANLMFGGVLAVGVVGAALARFRPDGMARALAATALAQMAVAAVALGAGWGAGGPAWPLQLVALTGFFAALWLISAWLFQKAAREQSRGVAAP
jgi:hypothetical protein